MVQEYDLVFAVKCNWYSQQIPLKFNKPGELYDYLSELMCPACSGFGEFDSQEPQHIAEDAVLGGKTVILCDKCKGTGFDPSVS